MKSWVWITASLAALFGLQGALCSMACAESPSSELAGPQAADPMPCHEAPAEDPSPAPAHPDSDAPCSCEASVVAVLEASEAVTANPAAGILPTRVVHVEALRGVSTDFHWRAPERLPPLDVLLLNTTLLI